MFSESVVNYWLIRQTEMKLSSSLQSNSSSNNKRCTNYKSVCGENNSLQLTWAIRPFLNNYLHVKSGKLIILQMWTFFQKWIIKFGYNGKTHDLKEKHEHMLGGRGFLPFINLWQQQFELKGFMFSLARWCFSTIKFARLLALSHRGYVTHFTQEDSFQQRSESDMTNFYW